MRNYLCDREPSALSHFLILALTMLPSFMTTKLRKVERITDIIFIKTLLVLSLFIIQYLIYFKIVKKPKQCALKNCIEKIILAALKSSISDETIIISIFSSFKKRPKTNVINKEITKQKIYNFNTFNITITKHKLYVRILIATTIMVVLNIFFNKSNSPFSVYTLIYVTENRPLTLLWH